MRQSNNKATKVIKIRIINKIRITKNNNNNKIKEDKKALAEMTILYMQMIPDFKIKINRMKKGF